MSMPSIDVFSGAASETAPLSDDLIWGIKGIAKEINRTQRQTYHMVAMGQLACVGKKGGRHFALRSKLRKEFMSGAGA
jgi:hypothetical protein